MVAIYTLNISDLNLDQSFSAIIHPSRLETASRFKFAGDKARCIGAGILLSIAVYESALKISLPPEEGQLPHGKPYLLEAPGFHYNISHSRDWVVCAVSDKPVGIDIEHSDRDAGLVAGRYFSHEENEYIASLPSSEHYGAIMELWVLRESYLKATGQGLAFSLKDIAVRFDPGPYIVQCGKKTDYSMALCRMPDERYKLGLAVCKGPEPLTYVFRQVCGRTLMVLRDS
ncbi:4'-phosphopantetheinyl transferase family protein [Desulfonatronovibrio magnus]|uniref:4'-phosphopantetheinyl transferase family protein n=1 Tax=Desulfonatronovibrio magnus TaxID=698827 RepID=UPI0006987C45|nr:4'-phosphopantetheinyl transferase superfamily protein [Desulfonatronovibrio magnus]RQD65376.1 MAG: 4'-phosphopantetheinyl transferase superfamily protein [Desulfonatronovibrio sp. MSAO_Bac4]